MQAPHYSADDFPGDVLSALRSGFLAALVTGAVSWLGGRWYLVRAYPGHRELLPFAATLGLVDGLLIGGLAAIFSFAARLWRRERLQRRRSDDLLRQELDVDPDTAAKRD